MFFTEIDYRNSNLLSPFNQVIVTESVTTGLKCELSDSDYQPLKDFDLVAYIATGTFDYTEVKNNEIKLTVIFDQGAAFHLTETPLSTDQKMVNKRDGRIQITATVKNSLQLRWWLLGFGEYVEVIKPKALRDEFIETSQRLSEIYQK